MDFSVANLKKLCLMLQGHMGEDMAQRMSQTSVDYFWFSMWPRARMVDS